MKDLRYDLAIEVAADSLDFQGVVRIGSPELPDHLTLDSVGLAVASVETPAGPVPFEIRKDAGELRIGPIPDPGGPVTVHYSGRIDDGGLAGFYVSPLGRGRVYTTDLEPTVARQVLPCLDRPDRKAVFAIELTHPSAHLAISNTPPVEQTTLPDGRVRTRFAPTPPMATYLLYIGVGPFEVLEGPSPAPQVIVAAAEGRSKDGQFAVEHASRILQYFGDYYGIPFPLPKLHLIAIPHYGSGAMENWGAITFQEYYLLLGERSPPSTRMMLADVLAHEIAHQWFGNLVTMRWWEDLWLNESFATFVGFRAVNALFPEWRAWEHFLRDQTAGAMMWDALPSTHPVRAEVSNPDQIQQIFDQISYGKGASLLRMAEGFLGETSFRSGVQRYLRLHQGSNADGADLWQALAAESKEDVQRILGSWIDRPGFPLVIVSRSSDGLRLAQRRFGSNPGNSDPPWPIPFTLMVDGRLERRLVDVGSVEWKGVSGSRVVANPGRTGFYRVRYEGELAREVRASARTLPAIDRWGLLNDALALYLAGESELEEYLEVLAAARDDPEPFVVDEVSHTFYIHHPLIHRIPRWKSDLGRVVQAQLERIGLSSAAPEGDRVRGMREGLIEARAHLDPAFARSLADRFFEVDQLPAEVAGAVLIATAITGGEAGYEALRARLSTATGVEAGRQVAVALGCTDRPDRLRECLDLAFTGSIPIGVWSAVFGAAIYHNPERAGTTWQFLQDRMGDIARLTAGTGSAGRFLQAAIPSLGIGRRAEMERWLTANSFAESGRGIQFGLEMLERYERSIERNG
ncbi:MAG TPA: M1 family metallopeptidase [Thermoplasmata archaeon]|nr:M1 family metallopeptidase [Thermoplasmata archaeon]